MYEIETRGSRKVRERRRMQKLSEIALARKELYYGSETPKGLHCVVFYFSLSHQKCEWDIKYRGAISLSQNVYGEN